MKLSSLVVAFWMTISCGGVSLTWSSNINGMFSVKNGVFFNGGISSELVESVANGIQKAMDSCRSAFKWDRWNCPESAFSRRRQQQPTKEQAITYAMVSAGLVHAVTRNCSRGQLKGCGCDSKFRYTNSIPIYAPETGGRFFPGSQVTTDNRRKKINWSWGGCSDDVAFGQNIAKAVFDQLERGNDPQAYMNLHNNHVGRTIVRSTMRKKCRCHGLSGSCSLQTCWMQVAPFTEIASILRERYKKAVKIDFENRSNRIQDRPQNADVQKVQPNRLIYLEDSPNYCHANNTMGWPGTKGRSCSRSRSETTTKLEKRSCRNLCRKCGHRVRKTKRQIITKCNCSFKWCCEVQCDTCTETVDEFFCD